VNPEQVIYELRQALDDAVASLENCLAHFRDQMPSADVAARNAVIENAKLLIPWRNE